MLPATVSSAGPSLPATVAVASSRADDTDHADPAVQVLVVAVLAHRVEVGAEPSVDLVEVVVEDLRCNDNWVVTTTKIMTTTSNTKQKQTTINNNRKQQTTTMITTKHKQQ